MNDINRASHDEEIARLHEILSRMKPTDEQYATVLRSYDILVRAATEDDKVKFEANVEDLKLKDEMDRQNAQDQRERRAQKVNLILGIASSAVTVVVYAGMIIANLHIHRDTLEFEENGYSLTSKSDKHLMKYPNKL